MRHLAPGPRLTQRGDERQTPLGRYLAVSHLDELPQLWNVLRGEMRLVGPRPEVEEFVSDQRESYERILRVPPGLTGPTQLASADEGALLASAADREVLYRETILPGKVQLDLAYVASNSLRGDLAIVAKTCLLPVVRAGYWLGALAGADRAGRVVAAKVLLSVLLAVLVLGVFTVQASAG